MSKKTEKGVSLYLILLIMSVLLGVGLGTSALLIRQIRMIKGVGDSVVAFYAADSGIEKAIYALYKVGVPIGDITCGDSNSPCESLSNGSSFFLAGFSAPTADCPAPSEYFCIKSVGTYKGVRRAIEVAR